MIGGAELKCLMILGSNVMATDIPPCECPIASNVITDQMPIFVIGYPTSNNLATKKIPQLA